MRTGICGHWLPRIRRLSALATCGLATGCGILQPGGISNLDRNALGVDLHSTFPVLTRAQIEKINLFKLLDPENLAEEIYKRGAKPNALEFEALAEDMKLAFAFAAFYEGSGGNANRLKLRRNRIQERILEASVQRCNIFKVYLQRSQSNTEFGLGSLATVTGVAGALVNGIQAARNLAGASGIFSGIRAEYNQAYFSNLSSSVISDGIRRLQEEAYERIQLEGQTRSIEDYSVEAAVKDVIYFDGLCSVVAGLTKASDAIRLLADPGIDTANRVILKAQATRRILDKEITTLSELRDTGYEAHSGTHGLIGTRLGASTAAARALESPLDTINALNADLAAVDARVDSIASKFVRIAAVPREKFDEKKIDLSNKLRDRIATVRADMNECHKVASFTTLAGQFDTTAGSLQRATDKTDRTNLEIEQFDQLSKFGGFVRRSAANRTAALEFLTTVERAAIGSFEKQQPPPAGPDAVVQFFVTEVGKVQNQNLKAAGCKAYTPA